MKNNIKKKWLKEYNGLKEHLEYPDCSLYDLIEKTANKYPDYIAYNYYGTKCKFKDLIKKIKECATSLKEIGIEKDDVVTVCMPNTPEAVIMFYAINLVGGISNMIHPLSAENEIKHYFNISNSKAVLTIDLAYSKIKNIINETSIKKVIVVSAKNSMPLPLNIGYSLTEGRKTPKITTSNSVMYYKDFIKKGIGKTPNFPKKIGSDYASIIYSGGTSGLPKAVLLTNKNFNACAMQNYEMVHNLGPGDSALAVLPVFHGFGLGICIHTVLYFGGCSILIPRFNAKEVDKLLKKYQPNVVLGVPTLFEAIINHQSMDNINLSFVKCVISGGDSLSANLKAKIEDFFMEHGSKIIVREGYGLAECIAACCLMPLGKSKDNCIGLPYPDMYIKIVEPNTHEECQPDKEGEICISGPTVMTGYLNDEKSTMLTLQKHEDGLVWLHTGDLGMMDEDGYVYFKQRLKRMIVSSGYNLYPKYIENVIESHEAVLTSTVIGIPHPYKKQVAKAFIVLKEGYEETEELKSDIKEHCKKNLAKYSIPHDFEYRTSLPKTLIGKVNYRELEEENNKNFVE